MGCTHYSICVVSGATAGSEALFEDRSFTPKAFVGAAESLGLAEAEGTLMVSAVKAVLVSDGAVGALGAVETGLFAAVDAVAGGLTAVGSFTSKGTVSTDTAADGATLAAAGAGAGVRSAAAGSGACVFFAATGAAAASTGWISSFGSSSSSVAGVTTIF
jgi:hypothetical protein